MNFNLININELWHEPHWWDGVIRGHVTGHMQDSVLLHTNSCATVGSEFEHSAAIT